MKKILLGRSSRGVFATEHFPKAGDVSVQGWILSEKTVEDYVFGGGYALVEAELFGGTVQIALDDLLPTFHSDLSVYGAGKTYYKLDGEPEAQKPQVLFTRSGKNMVKPYGYIETLPKETTKLTAEAELGILFDKDGNVVGYCYGADPTTREGDKSGIKSGAYAVSFAVLTKDNKPLNADLTYSFEGENLNRSFDCAVVNHLDRNQGLYWTPEELINYLLFFEVSGMMIQGPGLLLAGNPADKLLRVEYDSEAGFGAAEKAFVSKVLDSLETTGFTQSALLEDKLVFSMFFDI